MSESTERYGQKIQCTVYMQNFWVKLIDFKLEIRKIYV